MKIRSLWLSISLSSLVAVSGCSGASGPPVTTSPVASQPTTTLQELKAAASRAAVQSIPPTGSRFTPIGVEVPSSLLAQVGVPLSTSGPFVHDRGERDFLVAIKTNSSTTSNKRTTQDDGTCYYLVTIDTYPDGSSEIVNEQPLYCDSGSGGGGSGGGGGDGGGPEFMAPDCTQRTTSADTSALQLNLSYDSSGAGTLQVEGVYPSYTLTDRVNYYLQGSIVYTTSIAASEPSSAGVVTVSVHAPPGTIEWDSSSATVTETNADGSGQATTGSVSTGC